MFNEHQKIIPGFVIQNYITLPSGSMQCQSQSFVAGDQVDYERDGEPIEVDATKEVYCPFEMVTPEQVSTGGVKFVCPDCNGTQIECCEDGPYVSDVLNIDDEGDFDYGEISASGMVVRYQCHCGFILTENPSGHNPFPITEHEEVVEWCKKNCNQE